MKALQSKLGQSLRMRQTCQYRVNIRIRSATKNEMTAVPKRNFLLGYSPLMRKSYLWSEMIRSVYISILTYLRRGIIYRRKAFQYVPSLRNIGFSSNVKLLQSAHILQSNLQH